MIASNYSLSMQEVMAKNIIMSRGGLIYLSAGMLSLTVRHDDGTSADKAVLCVRMKPSQPEYVFVDFEDCSGRVEDEDDRKKVFAFLIETYSYPERALLNVDALRDRLRIRIDSVSFISAHGDLNESDFVAIGAMRDAIARLRDEVSSHPVPIPGDLIEGPAFDGDEAFRFGVLVSERISERNPSDGTMLLNKIPYTPWATTLPGGGLAVHAGGGPFNHIRLEDLEFVGSDERRFAIWGHEGPCAAGAIFFTAKVNRWRMKDVTE